ncbi:MAG: hypothetical protein ABI634_13855 [Acidobacteriota bacterium]
MPRLAGVLSSTAAFALPLVILIERGWSRLATPDFWAEDGAVFLRQALEEGSRSLLHPMAGSFFTLERSIMLIALKAAPLVWVPFVVCLACIAVTALVMSRLASDAYSWLVPSRAVRLAAVCLMCLLPGLNEMLGNLCNVNWILFAGVALIGLKDPDRPLTAAELVVTALISVSVGTAILLVPLFLWRLVMTTARRRSPTREVLAIAILILLGGVLPAVFGGSEPSAPPGVRALDIARIWYDHIARLVAFTPWIGDRLTVTVSHWRPQGLYRVGKIGFVIFLAAWAWRRRRDARAQALLALLAGVSAWTALSSLTRVYAFDFFQNQTGLWFYESRYSFIVSFTAVLFWLVVLQDLPRLLIPRATVAMGFLALSAALSMHRFNIDAYSNPRFHARVVGTTVVADPVTDYRVDGPIGTHWQDVSDELDRARRTGCPHRVIVHQYPDPWAFTFVNPNPAAGCS